MVACMCEKFCVYVCVRACVYVRVCARTCVCLCARASVCVCVWGGGFNIPAYPRHKKEEEHISKWTSDLKEVQN